MSQEQEEEEKEAVFKTADTRSQKKKTELLSKQQLVFVFKDFKFARANKKPKLVCQQSTCHRPKLLQIRNVFQTYTNSIKCQNAPSLSKSVN